MGYHSFAEITACVDNPSSSNNGLPRPMNVGIYMGLSDGPLRALPDKYFRFLVASSFQWGWPPDQRLKLDSSLVIAGTKTHKVFSRVRSPLSTSITEHVQVQPPT